MFPSVFKISLFFAKIGIFKVLLTNLHPSKPEILHLKALQLSFYCSLSFTLTFDNIARQSENLKIGGPVSGGKRTGADSGNLTIKQEMTGVQNFFHFDLFSKSKVKMRGP